MVNLSAGSTGPRALHGGHFTLLAVSSEPLLFVKLTLLPRKNDDGLSSNSLLMIQQYTNNMMTPPEANPSKCEQM